MRFLIVLLIVTFSTTINAVDYEKLVQEQVENIAKMYSDGFSKLDDKSIRSWV